MYQKFEEMTTKSILQDLRMGYDVLNNPIIKGAEEDIRFKYAPLDIKLTEDEKQSKELAKEIEKTIRRFLTKWFIIERSEQKIIPNTYDENYVLQLYYIMKEKKIKGEQTIE